jgi:hypothetical protein
MNAGRRIEMKTLEQQAAAAAKAHVALMAVLAAEAVEPLSFPSDERAAVLAAAIPIIDREFRRHLAELEKGAYGPPMPFIRVAP